jgi:hypothetical protein
MKFGCRVVFWYLGDLSGGGRDRGQADSLQGPGRGEGHRRRAISSRVDDLPSAVALVRKLTLIFVMCTSLWAQRTPDYDHSVVSQIRLDARDLGCAPVDLIPPEESAIGALTIGPGVAIYRATSGKRSHLFVLYPEHGYVQPQGFLARE